MDAARRRGLGFIALAIALYGIRNVPAQMDRAVTGQPVRIMGVLRDLMLMPALLCLPDWRSCGGRATRCRPPQTRFARITQHRRFTSRWPIRCAGSLPRKRAPSWTCRTRSGRRWLAVSRGSRSDRSNSALSTPCTVSKRCTPSVETSAARACGPRSGADVRAPALTSLPMS